MMAHRSANQSRLTIVSLFLLSLFLFTWGLVTQEITSFDSRFYLFAKEMWRNGISWFPTTYGQPYPDYPVTSTLLIYLSAKLFGGLNKLTAVLPSAIAAAWTVTLTYRIGALRDRFWGLAAVCFTLITLMFLKSARGISLDMYPAMITTWCFYLVYANEMKPSRHVRWIYLLLAVSFAFRGPIGLVMPAGVVCSYYFLNRDWKKLILFGISALIILAACTAALFFAAYHAGGTPFLQDVIRMQVAGRIDNPYLPIYFYFTNSLGNYALSYPLALIALVVLTISGFFSRLKKSVDAALLLKLLGWTVIILIGMSIPGDKKARYILPMVPAIALIAAYPFAKKMQSARSIAILFFVAVSLDAIYIKAVEPYLMTFDKAQQFVVTMEMMRAKAGAKLVFYREQPDGTPIKYQIYNQQGDNPDFISSEQQLLNFKSPAFFITSADYFSQLPASTVKHFNIIARDRVGHVMMVVFVRK
jgi:4-amino-4-deoxy-L-arabinose transferase-like glycosyltransferase